MIIFIGCLNPPFETASGSMAEAKILIIDPFPELSPDKIRNGIHRTINHPEKAHLAETLYLQKL